MASNEGQIRRAIEGSRTVYAHSEVEIATTYVELAFGQLHRGMASLANCRIQEYLDRAGAALDRALTYVLDVKDTDLFAAHRDQASRALRQAALLYAAIKAV